jgi:hypothetical protein
MPRIKKRVLDEKELKQLEGMAAIRLPLDQIATLLGFGSERALSLYLARDTAARLRMNEGRGKAAANFRQTAYALAMKSGPQQMRAVEFWGRTQEGFKTTDAIELSGPSGGAIETKDMSKEEVQEAAMAMARKLCLVEDE